MAMHPTNTKARGNCFGLFHISYFRFHIFHYISIQFFQ